MAETKVNKYIWVAAVLVAITLAVTISSVVAYDKAYAGEYKGNQAYSETNSCGNEDMPMNVQCSNMNSGAHGRDNTAALATAQGRPLISEVPDMITDGFLKIKEAIIKPFGQLNPPTGQDNGGLDAFLKTHGLIPENGEEGAFGYGILTTNTAEGDGSLIVATTHAGVLDSEIQQGDENNPIWHNHFITLKGDATNCGTTKGQPNPAVDAITFDQPGDVEIEGKTAELTQIPNVFTSDDSLTGEEITLEPGNVVPRDAENVVSFKLMPKFDKISDELLAVCVTDITPAEKKPRII
jgi:hypothetical protein